MECLAGHQLGSSDLLLTLLEELGEHQGLPEPGTSSVGCAQPAPGDGVYVLAELRRVEMGIFLAQTFGEMWLLEEGEI